MARERKALKPPENAKPAEAIEPVTSETQEAEPATTPETPVTPAAPASRRERVTIASIKRDPALSFRVGGVKETVAKEYAVAMKEGAKFPPVVVFQDAKGDGWLADGFHRCAAAEDLGDKEIEAEIWKGERRDALLFAAGANAGHGRTGKDKQQAVLALLADPEWQKWSDAIIAAKCAVSRSLVQKLRSKQPATVAGSTPRQGADGKIRGSKSSKAKRPKLSEEQQRKADERAREKAIDAIKRDLTNVIRTYRKRWPASMIQATARLWLDSLKSSNDAEKTAEGGAA